MKAPNSGHTGAELKKKKGKRSCCFSPSPFLSPFFSLALKPGFIVALMPFVSSEREREGELRIPTEIPASREDLSCAAGDASRRVIRGMKP